MSAVIFRYLSSGCSDWPPWIFAAYLRLFFFSTKEGFQSTWIWSIYDIICSFHENVKALTILKWTWKTDCCNLCIFLFLYIRKLPNWYLFILTSPVFLDLNVFPPSFALVTHLVSVTFAMLHRCTRSYSHQNRCLL